MKDLKDIEKKVDKLKNNQIKKAIQEDIEKKKTKTVLK